MKVLRLSDILFYFVEHLHAGASTDELAIGIWRNLPGSIALAVIIDLRPHLEHELPFIYYSLFMLGMTMAVISGIHVRLYIEAILSA